MRIAFRISIAVLFFSLTGCSLEYLRTRKQLRAFERSAVVLPDDLLKVNKGTVEIFDDYESSANTFFIVYDSVRCGDCFVSRLYSLIPLKQIVEEEGLKFLCIASFAEDDYEDFIKNYSQSDLMMDMLLDYSGSFRDKNPSFPYNPRLNSFCTNSLGNPIYVGNPSLDYKSYSKFIKSLKTR